MRVLDDALTQAYPNDRIEMASMTNTTLVNLIAASTGVDVSASAATANTFTTAQTAQQAVPWTVQHDQIFLKRNLKTQAVHLYVPGQYTSPDLARINDQWTIITVVIRGDVTSDTKRVEAYVNGSLTTATAGRFAVSGAPYSRVHLGKGEALRGNNHHA